MPVGPACGTLPVGAGRVTARTVAARATLLCAVSAGLRTGLIAAALTVRSYAGGCGRIGPCAGLRAACGTVGTVTCGGSLRLRRSLRRGAVLRTVARIARRGCGTLCGGSGGLSLRGGFCRFGLFRSCDGCRLGRVRNLGGSGNRCRLCSRFGCFRRSGRLGSIRFFRRCGFCRHLLFFRCGFGFRFFRRFCFGLRRLCCLFRRRSRLRFRLCRFLFLCGLFLGRNVGLPVQIIADVADLMLARQRIEQNVKFRRFKRFLNCDLLSALCEHIAKVLAFQPEVFRQFVDFELCFVISHISS